MYFLDLVDHFQDIISVNVETDGKTVKVVGYANGLLDTVCIRYNHNKVAKAVAERVSSFIGV